MNAWLTYVNAAASGFALSAGLIVAIGAQNAFVLRQGLRKEHVALIILFCAGCDAVLIAIGCSGVGMILEKAQFAIAPMLLLAATFLILYGLRAARRTMQRECLSPAVQSMSQKQVLGSLAVVTLLNPHVYLDTVLLLGTVASKYIGVTRVLFACGAVTASVTWFILLGYGASVCALVFARPMAWRLLDGLIAIVMLVLGVGMAQEAWHRLHG